MLKPGLPQPEPLRGVDSHPFPHDTITRRFPKIVRHVIQGRDWSAATIKRLEALVEEIPGTPLQAVEDDGGPDVAGWGRDMAPYAGQNWLEAPWFVVETWFFRRILAATGYYSPGPGQGVDPYGPQKREGLGVVPGGVQAVCAQLAHLRESPTWDLQAALTGLLRSAIWGNQADLSMWPAGDGEGPGGPGGSQTDDHLLVDQASTASRYLVGLAHNARVDFILDNVGLELAYDLMLADFLLATGLAHRIRFHAKPHPTYVSDATIQDVRAMVTFLASAQALGVEALGQRLEGYLADGELVLTDHYFWTSPLSCWQMPTGLYHELAQADLLVNKGDANYRRWLGDRNWPYTMPVAAIVNYKPAPWLALRICKANLAAGLSPGQPQALDQQDPDWLVNGKWGMIQFVD